MPTDLEIRRLNAAAMRTQQPSLTAGPGYQEPAQWIDAAAERRRWNKERLLAQGALDIESMNEDMNAARNPWERMAMALSKGVDVATNIGDWRPAMGIGQPTGKRPGMARKSKGVRAGGFPRSRAMPLSSIMTPDAIAELKKIAGVPVEKSLNADEMLGAAEMFRRQNFGAPVTGREDMSNAYTESLNADLTRPGIGEQTPGARFYRDSAEKGNQELVRMGQSLGKNKNTRRAGEILADPANRMGISALISPFSTGMNPKDEYAQGGEAIAHWLLSGTAPGAPKRSPVEHLEAALHHKPGTLNPETGDITNWHRHGKNTANRVVKLGQMMEDVSGGTPDIGDAVAALSRFLSTPQDLQTVQRLRGYNPLKKTGQYPVSEADFVPQALAEQPGMVEGQFAVGPKTGPYSFASTYGAGRFAPMDEQGTRGMLLRLGGLLNEPGAGGPMTMETLTQLLKANRAFRAGKGPNPFLTAKGEDAGLILAGPRSADDRFAYQHGFQHAGDPRMDPAMKQAIDWGPFVKDFLRMGGVSSPEGSVEAGLKVLADRTAETGTPVLQRPMAKSKPPRKGK